MIDRVFNPNNQRYGSYGAIGVTICDKWKTFDGFLDDFDKIEGFDYNKLLSHELCLDKDKIDPFNKEYCLEKCSLISKSDNNRYKPNQQHITTAISPDNTMYIFSNQSEFARKYGLRQTCISDCLSGKCKTHKNWKFYRASKSKSID